MILNKIDDPRDSLEKAHRLELVKFAHAHGVKEITELMPAILIRRTLRAKGLTNIHIPPRALGQQNQAAPVPNGNEKGVTMDAEADLARQYQAQAAPQPQIKRARPAKYKRLRERPPQEINLLRDECKRLGIHMDRRDRKDDLKRKIAEHGQDASQLRQ